MEALHILLLYVSMAVVAFNVGHLFTNEDPFLRLLAGIGVACGLFGFVNSAVVLAGGSLFGGA